MTAVPGFAGAGARIGLFYAALCLIYGVHLPFLPVWLDSRGLTAADIAIVTSIPLLLRMAVVPAVAMVADRTGEPARLIVVVAWTAAAAILALAASASFWPILFTAAAYAIAVAALMPLVETVAISGARERGLHYGRMRLWGSLSFLAIALAGGAAIDAAGPEAAIALLGAATAATVAAAYLLPPDAPPIRDGFAEIPPFADGARRLLRSRPFVLLLCASGAAQGAHAVMYAFGALHWQAQGLSGTWIGALWAIGIMAEVALFAMSGTLLARFGPWLLLIAGTGAGVLRWIAMAFDPPLTALVALQILHGFTYGLAHLAALHAIDRHASRGATAVAQALNAIAAGAFMALATLGGGWLYSSVGGLAYLAMGALSLAALIAAVAAWRGGEAQPTFRPGS